MSLNEFPPESRPHATASPSAAVVAHEIYHVVHTHALMLTVVSARTINSFHSTPPCTRPTNIFFFSLTKKTKLQLFVMHDDSFPRSCQETTPAELIFFCPSRWSLTRCTLQRRLPLLALHCSDPMPPWSGRRPCPPLPATIKTNTHSSLRQKKYLLLTWRSYISKYLLRTFHLLVYLVSVVVHDGMLPRCTTPYRNPSFCRVFDVLPGAICRALGKINLYRVPSSVN